MDNISKPPMYAKGKTLFLTIAYPPNPTASAVVHRHLLDQFDPASFVVLTAFFVGAKRAEVPHGIHRRYIYVSFEFLSSRVHKFFARIQKKTIPLFLKFYINKIKPARIVIGYPDLYWLDICSAVALKKNIPFIPYLHDTIVEATYFGRSKELAAEVQNRVFVNAHNITVMSEGMRSLYKEKYNLSSIALEHIYPEKISSIDLNKENRAHWSGDVYQVNHRSVYRLNKALAEMRMKFSISNGKTREQLQAFEITGDHIEKAYHPLRSDYLKQLSTAKILLLGLNYADECAVHEDELASIFSTKTAEYLASGSLIVYHGPKHYFLSQFLIKNNCGIVIDTRDQHVLLDELKNIIQHYDQHHHIIENALNSLSIFDARIVSKKFIAALDA